MLSHMAEDGTVPRRIPREYESSMAAGWGGRSTSHTAQGTTHVGQPCHAPHAAARRWNEQQQFCRSASARLPRTRHPAALDPDDDDYDYGERSSEQDSRDGERKIQQVGSLLVLDFPPFIQTIIVFFMFHKVQRSIRDLLKSMWKVVSLVFDKLRLVRKLFLPRSQV